MTTVRPSWPAQAPLWPPEYGSARSGFTVAEVLFAVNGNRSSRRAFPSGLTISANTHFPSPERNALFTSNLSGAEVADVRVSVDVQSLGAAQREVVLRDGPQELGRWTVTDDATTRIELTTTAPPGYHRLTVEVSGEPVRDDAENSVSARFSSLTVSTAGTTRVASLQEQAATGVVHA